MGASKKVFLEEREREFIEQESERITPSEFLRSLALTQYEAMKEGRKIEKEFFKKNREKND